MRYCFAVEGRGRVPRKMRLARRLARHHLVFGILAGVAAFLIGEAFPSRDPVFRASLATGYVSLGFLAATLLTGAVNVLRCRPNPVSTDLRRDLGIWAAILGLVHVVMGLQVHMPGRWWLYFVYAPAERHVLPIPVRLGLFGFGNYTGLAATLVLALLLALSNDLSLRRLGATKWKSLQRWNYALFGLTVVHSIAYQLIERRRWAFVVGFAILVATVALFQLLGYRSRTRRHRALAS